MHSMEELFKKQEFCWNCKQHFYFAGIMSFLRKSISSFPTSKTVQVSKICIIYCLKCHQWHKTNKSYLFTCLLILTIYFCTFDLISIKSFQTVYEQVQKSKLNQFNSFSFFFVHGLFQVTSLRSLRGDACFPLTQNGLLLCGSVSSCTV